MSREVLFGVFVRFYQFRPTQQLAVFDRSFSAMSSGQPVLPVPQQALHGYDEVPATAPPPAASFHGNAAAHSALAVPLAGRQAQAENRAQLRCVATGLCLHILVVALVNALVWALYLILLTDSYPWPMWVSFGTSLSIFAHIVNVLPWTLPRREGCPRWLMSVLGNIALGNFTVWMVWAFTSCGVDDSGPYYCGGYMWPMWVTVPSGFAACVLVAAAARVSGSIENT
ncbi:unnamed protein product [Symbiodinium sp. CCMP2456]|nr:unnamed protein product [Symbiodinium sp. CCMP2456]